MPSPPLHAGFPQRLTGKGNNQFDAILRIFLAFSCAILYDELQNVLPTITTRQWIDVKRFYHVDQLPLIYYLRR